MAAQFATVEEYIGSFPGDVQDILREVRSTIRGAVPEAGERISYGIAAFTLGGRDLVYFAGWKKHISVYPVPTEDADLTQELAPYLAARGTLKFLLGKPVPYPLIGRVAVVLARQRNTEEAVAVALVREPAAAPEDLGRLFLQRAGAGDVAGVVALYEPGAVLATPGGELAVGTDAILAVYQALLASRPQFTGEVQPALRSGDLALTSTRFPGGATAEIARRQPDGSWLWAADQPRVVAGS